MVLDAQGNLYGTTTDRGFSCDPNLAGDCGTVFKLDPADNETVLYSFIGFYDFNPGGSGFLDGAGPVAGLVLDAQGNLYGTTEYGGNLSCFAGNSSGCGTVFKLGPAGNETVLYSFTGTGGDGMYPGGGLVLDTQGNFYGTTEEGGALACAAFSSNGCGTVFKLTPNTITVNNTGDPATTSGDGFCTLREAINQRE